MELNQFAFIDDEMSIEQQVEILKQQYTKLLNKSHSDRKEWHRAEEKGMKLIKQYQQENERMATTNKLSVKLVESLKKQIEKYQNNDNFEQNNSNDDEIDNWKARYLSEKRTSQYLRAECEDLLTEIEELKENTTNSAMADDGTPAIEEDADNNDLEEMLKIVNEAWEEEVATLIEKYQNKNGLNKDFKKEIRMSFDKKKQQILEMTASEYTDYELLYHQVVKSKIDLIQETSQEIERLRQIIYNQNHTLYRNIFDRIVRYHNLDGNEDTLFQLIVDAELSNPQQNIDETV